MNSIVKPVVWWWVQTTNSSFSSALFFPFFFSFVHALFLPSSSQATLCSPRKWIYFLGILASLQCCHKGKEQHFDKLALSDIETLAVSFKRKFTIFFCGKFNLISNFSHRQQLPEFLNLPTWKKLGKCGNNAFLPLLPPSPLLASFTPIPPPPPLFPLSLWDGCNL